ncbi:hypothetical protein CKAH01_06308 [Colletotrichum kahawae]|uniref:UVI-1 protein n=1 Tax=Colletotrichum kahawae TaxID=34407 RepID=A0AAE0D4A8_COLKA|nr:hypothetical protein CKAH01_06308 [Colletotrichum kahawae]
MQFSTIKFAIAALALCSNTVLGQTTPAQVVSNINMVTEKSQALQAPAQEITAVNGALLAVGMGPFPKIIQGFTEIVTITSTALQQMQGMPPVAAGPDAAAIAEAFRDFVRVHQALLNILIGKAGLLSTVPFVGAPVAAVLRSVESVVDTLAFSLIDSVEGQATQLNSDYNGLSSSLETAIKSYTGIVDI